MRENMTPPKKVDPQDAEQEDPMKSMRAELVQINEQHQKLTQEIRELKQEVKSLNNKIQAYDKRSGDTLDEDTFSIMMTSRLFSKGWFLGTLSLLFQLILLAMILWGQFQSSIDSAIFNVPFSVSPEVTVGQFFTIILSLLTQQDVLTAIKYLIIFRNYTPNGSWNQLLINETEEEFKDKNKWVWFRRAILPNVLKLLQGLLVLLASFILIIQSRDLIDLLKDFTALFFVSEIDNIVFKATDQCYFGHTLKGKAEVVKNVHIEDLPDHDAILFTVKDIKIRVRACILPFLFAAMLSAWLFFVNEQLAGDFFRQKYPNCTEVDSLPKIQKMGNGQCDGSFYNTLRCGFDDGDCVDFKLAYPNCEAGADAYTIGNGRCNENYNNPECLFDGGDCCPFDLATDTELNNGVCDGGRYNTKACNYDAYDCEDFNLHHPACPIEKLAFMIPLDSTKSVVIGDHICDSGIYMTVECGYEGEDCRECAQLIPEGTESLIGNGICNGYPYASKECGFDGGDCDQCAEGILHVEDCASFKLNHPECSLADMSDQLDDFPHTKPIILGDGVCDSTKLNTIECGFENGDCSECRDLVLSEVGSEADIQSMVGNGICNGYPYIAKECDYDGSDCIECIGAIPNGTELRVGDGFCNGGKFNTSACVNDGGDCAEECPPAPSSRIKTWFIVAVDINQDGLVDLVLGNRYKSNQVLLNKNTTPAVSFHEPISLPGGNMDSISIVTADMNGDGIVDIIVGNGSYPNGTSYQPNQLLITKKSTVDADWMNGDLSSQIEVITLPGGNMYTYSIAVGDFNNDGLPDIIVGNYLNAANQLILNNSTATGDETIPSFQEAIDLPTSSGGKELWTQSIVAADVNNDGLLDIVIGNSYSHFENQQLLINNSTVTGPGTTPTFESPIDLPGGGYTGTISIVAADVNNDGYVDLVVGNQDKPNQLRINSGPAALESRDEKHGDIFKSSIDLPNSSGVNIAAAADVNGDGYIDLVMNSYGPNQVLINSGIYDASDGSSIFVSSAVEFPCSGDSYTEAVAVADMDNDGHPDFIFGNGGNYPNKNQLLMNLGDGISVREPGAPGSSWLTSE